MTVLQGRAQVFKWPETEVQGKDTFPVYHVNIISLVSGWQCASFYSAFPTYSLPLTKARYKRNPDPKFEFDMMNKKVLFLGQRLTSRECIAFASVT